MHFNHLIILSAVISTSAAGHDKGGYAGCASDFDKVWSTITDYPTPASSLRSFLSEQTLWSQWSTITDPCVVPTVTGSLAGEYTSWVSSLYSWESKHKDDISEAWGSCTDVSYTKDWIGFGYLPSEATTVCTSVTWVNEAAAASTSGTSSDAEGKQEDGGNAAPRQASMSISAIMAITALVVVVIL